MITVLSYQFDLKGDFEIEMPASSKILSVQEQNGNWVMWAQVNTELPIVTRTFKAYWTGEAMPDMFLTHLYVATVQDIYVWHIFEVVNPAVETANK